MPDVRSSTATIFSGLMANYAGFVVNIAIAFFLTPFLVHTLGDAQYGIWSIAASLSGYMSLLDLGISSALTRYVAKYKKISDITKLNSIINSALLLLLFCGFAVVLVSPIVSTILVRLINIDVGMQKTVKILAILISCDVAIFLGTGTFRGILRGLQRYDITNTVQVISGILNAILFFVFLTKGYGLVAMALISIFSKIVSIIFFTIFIKKYLSFIELSFRAINKDSIKIIFGHSVFSFINIIFSQIAYYSDSFVIGYFMNTAAVTYYTISWTLAEYVKKICMSLTEIYLPEVSKCDAISDHDKISLLLTHGTKHTLMIVSLPSIGLVVLGDYFIARWMGEVYADKIGLIVILFSIANIFTTPQLIGQSVLAGMTKHKIIAYANMVNAFVNLFISIVLIKKYGVVGVALGTVIPQLIISGVVLPCMTCRILNISVKKFFLDTYCRLLIPMGVLFCSLVGMVSIWKPVSYLIIILESTICSFIYFATLYYLSLDNNEQQFVKRIVLKLKINKNLIKR